jgi:chromosome segregation protein
MYLKKLDLQGFKSFADKTTLELEPGLTAVIGPNGSGKSNIVDAIRWVLGEQSIKTLRGSKLEDVIFAGTQARKSVSFAEVDITIDNSDGKLPLEYTEVTVTRRIYRSGESEFYINKNQCRLKDIVELFMDTGIGRDGYSIIGQGRIDEILSSKSEDRRHIFEDAAGIVKYKTRKEEAEKKLENTQQNLVRVNDIVTEIEGQIEPLRIQSEKAKKFLELREQLKHLEVGLFISEINKGKVKLDEILAHESEASEQIREEEEKLIGLQSAKEDTKQKIEELLAKIEKVQNNIFEAQNNIEKQKADIGVFSQKIQSNLENYDKAAVEIEEFESKKTELEKEKEEKKDKKTRLFDDKQRFEDELKEKEDEFKRLSEMLTGEQKKIEELKTKIMDNINIKLDKVGLLSNTKASIEASSRRIAQIGEEINENIHDLDKEKMIKEDEAIGLNKVEREQSSLKSKIDSLVKIKLESNEKIKSYEDSIRKTLDEIHNKESRHKFLVETEREFEGYNRAVKEVLLKCQNDKSFGNNIYGALASLINVPAEYEIPIEMVLGASIQNVVTESESDAKRAIEYLKTNNLGRASFLPIAAVKGNKLTENLKGCVGYIGVASDLISYDKKYEQIVLSLLGKTVVVTNMDEGINIAKKFKYNFRIVTLDGDVINPSGQMSGGSNFKKTTSILSRAREITELESLVKKLKQEHAKKTKELEDYKLSVESALEEFNECETKIQEINVIVATQNQKISAININVERISNKIANLNKEKENLLALIEKEKEETGTADVEIQKLQIDTDEMQSVVNEFTQKNREQQKIIDDLNSDIIDLKISVSSFDESSISIDEMVSRIDIDIQACVNSINKRMQDREKILNENTEMKSSIGGTDERIAEFNEKIKENEGVISELKGQREDKNLEIVDIERGVEEQFKTIDILREQATKLDVKKAKIEMDIETIQNKMWEDYETTPNTAKDYAEVTAQTAKEVEKNKNQIKELGSINIDSIEEYKVLKERFEFLTTQRNDLEEAEKSLNKIIADMIDIMKIQFAKQFELINKNFGEVFAELFGGGRAELRLADESNILESGIEIEVQPPGKKLQNMMLLSGGERALTAIALLFAILKINSSPFCILDEIEAALDDINIYRFADYLKKFSKKTQFLVITHRKGTMESSNTVYGVTMQEHGISKLISMQLN